MLLFSFAIQAQLVSTNAALTTAITNATAGSTIILANGTWSNVQISVQKTGTLASPIIIKAETPGSVFLEGNSFIKMGGTYVFIEGLVFQNPSNLNGSTPIIDFKSSSNCVNCKVTNVKIDAYNATGKETSTFKWVLLRGSYNEISYCSFLGKYGVGSIINDNRDVTDANYNKIHHNYFANRIPVGEVNVLNDQDAIRIGNSGTSLSDSFTEVYDNYFFNFSGEIEVISNKSCKNKYYNNTFRDHQGSLTLRHGNDCEVFSNFFIANSKLFSGGIRVIGENHKIYNNYIEGVNSKKPDNTTSSALGGINVSNGRVNSLLNGYYQVKNTTITNNTFVNCDFGIRVGTNVGSDLTLAPENLIIANNILVSTTSSVKAIDQLTAPTGSLSMYEGNIKQSGTWPSTVTGTNSSVTSGLIATTKTDFFRLITGSAAIDAGIGNYPFLTKDITGAIRPSLFDVGAEELNSGGAKVPYTSSDVGVKVGFYGNSILSVSKNNLEAKNLLLYPIPVSGDFLNVNYNSNLGVVRILNMQGQVILEEMIDASTAKINVSRLPKGAFVIQTQGISKVFIK